MTWLWILWQAAGSWFVWLANSAFLKPFVLFLYSVGVFVSGVISRGLWNRKVTKLIRAGEAAHGQVLFKQVLLPAVRARERIFVPGDVEEAEHQVLTMICVANPAADTVFGDEKVLKDEWYKRAKKCDLANPLVSMDNHIGSRILDRFAKCITALHRQHERKSSIWVLAPVHERHQNLRDRAPAVLLIRRDDIEKLAEWSFCTSLMVDERWNVAHICSLHYIAKEYAEYRKAYLAESDAGEPDKFNERFREVVLALNADWPDSGTDYHKPRWDDVKDLLDALKLKVTV